MATQKWNVRRNADGDIISMGFTNIAIESGDTLEQFDDVQANIMAEYKAADVARAATAKAQMDALKSAIENETITLPNLVKYLKANGCLP